jgi:hypothetical protein
MDVSNPATHLRRAGVGVALAAVTLAAVLLVGGATQDAPTSEPQGLQFGIRCAQSDTGEVSSVTCALVVSGLPEPLEDQVALAVFPGRDTSEAPGPSAAPDTVVVSEAPDVSPGAPALVTESLPMAPPPPVPLTPQVPQQPPKAL